MRLYLSSFRFGNQIDKLHELLRGGKRVALIGNSMDFLEGSARAESINQEMERLKAVDLDPIEVDLRNYFGKSGELKAELSKFDLVWARGGNAFILLRAFHQSGLDKVLKELLQEDTVAYGGYSAGICVLTPSLKSAELVDEPNTVPQGYSPDIIWQGLGILPYSLAPHYRSEHPESPLIEKMVQKLIDDRLLFKVLRDGEVLVIDGDNENILQA